VTTDAVGPVAQCLVQYNRGWSARICTPERRVKIMKNRLKKCCHRAQTGMPR
jgi:hypothetical protein